MVCDVFMMISCINHLCSAWQILIKSFTDEPKLHLKVCECRQPVLNSIWRALWFQQLNRCSSFISSQQIIAFPNFCHPLVPSLSPLAPFSAKTSACHCQLADALKHWDSVKGWACPVWMLVKAEGYGGTSREWETTSETNEHDQLGAERTGALSRPQRSDQWSITIRERRDTNRSSWLNKRRGKADGRHSKPIICLCLEQTIERVLLVVFKSQQDNPIRRRITPLSSP